jgi:hypothetical protein
VHTRTRFGDAASKTQAETAGAVGTKPEFVAKPVIEITGSKWKAT